MQIVEVLAPVLGARCLVLVAEDGSCAVVDAGAGVADRVDGLVRERGWRPQAVLATHGHLDHTWDAGVLAARWEVPVLLHVADAYRLADPFGSLGVLGRGVAGAASDATSPLGQALTAAGVDPDGYVEPVRVEPFGGSAGAMSGRSEDVTLELGGLRVVARHAPGHTQGSTLYLLDDEGRGEGPVTVAITGDVLFAGSVGRTDLPGGDEVAMGRTLREVVAALPSGAAVLPGHGPTSDVAGELARNPYLRRV
ncbi:MBL fold metallo-hydrolase [Cellulomonas soli]